MLLSTLLTSHRQLQQLEQQKKQLEHFNATIQEEKDTLVLQNNSLTERLEAVTNEKLPSHQFDGQTPIDKTLDLLQCLIMVGLALAACTYVCSLVHTACHSAYPCMQLIQILPLEALMWLHWEPALPCALECYQINRARLLSDAQSLNMTWVPILTPKTSSAWKTETVIAHM